MFSRSAVSQQKETDEEEKWGKREGEGWEDCKGKEKGIEGSQTILS